MVSVGIDVSKDKHDCFIINSDGEVLADVFSIPNNIDGFTCLLEKIHSCAHPQDSIKVGLETTGHNLNILEYAVSWRMVSLICLFLFAALTTVVIILLFCGESHLTAKKSSHRGIVQFRPHGNLFLHEGYKTQIMNRAFPILIVFSLIIGCSYLSKAYIYCLQQFLLIAEKMPCMMQQFRIS